MGFYIIILMENSKRSYKKIIIALAILVILGIVGVIIYNIMKSAELSIIVAPSTATVKIDGKEYSNGQYKFFPQSEVEVEISSPGYQTQTTTINLTPHEVTPLRAALEDEGGGYDSYLASEEAYADLALIAPMIGETRLTDFVEATDRKIAILDILPVNENTGEFYADQHGFIVSMDASATTIQIMPSDEDCGVIPCLDVYETNGDLNKVKDYIRRKGYDPDAYKYTMNELYLYEPDYGFPDIESD